MNPTKLLQPPSFEAFRCLGSDCEDTCCDGWGIIIDRETYSRYHECGDPELRPLLREFVAINETDRSDDHYARIELSGTGCPFLKQGLCSIQNRLGEEALSKTCATYPRIANLVDDVLQRSLDLSCPEAARLVLLDPNPIEFREEQREQDLSRTANLSRLNTAQSDKPYSHFWRVRGAVIAILQNRDYALWKRLMIVAHLCDKLAEGSVGEIPAVVEGYLDATARGLFDELLSHYSPQPNIQLEIALELIVGRITTDFTNRRFLECYQEFMHGIEWTTQSTMEQIGLRYAEVYFQFYTPFMSEHEYLLENYLVSYVYKTLFPFGPQESNHNLHQKRRTLVGNCMLMMAYFAAVKTILIGMAGFHKQALDTRHVVKLIQTFTRTFEHSLSYPERVAEILSGRNMTNAAHLAVLVQN